MLHGEMNDVCTCERDIVLLREVRPRTLS